MAIPAFETISAQLQGSGNGFSVDVPAGTAANDIIVVVCYFADATTTITTMPTGFQYAPSSPVSVASGPAQSVHIMWKRATGPDVGTYDFGMNANAYRNVAASRYSGSIPFGSPWNVTNSNADPTAGSVTPPVSVITTLDETLLVWVGTNWAGSAWTPPTGFTERRDSGDRVCTSADAPLAVAGTSGSITGSNAPGNLSRLAWLGALRPIPPATSGAANEGALTVSRLVDEVIDALHGYTRDQAQVTELANPMADTDLTFKVAEGSQLSRGLVEVDEELVYVKSVDINGNAQVFSWGRGQQGSLASGHFIGSKVTMAPLYPRQRIRDAVFGVLREIHPSIAPVGEQYLDVSAIRTNYAMPANTYHILRVESNPPGPSQMWVPVSRWHQNKTATTVELELIGPVFPGPQRARVMYLKDLPTTLGQNEDLAALGYPQDIHDCIVLGATAKMLALTEPARLQVQSVQASARSEWVPAGSITNVAKFVYSLYQQRLQELRFWFAERYPISPKVTR